MTDLILISNTDQKTIEAKVFKLEREPGGYNVILSPDCKIDIPYKSGLLTLNYDKTAIVGDFENLRFEGEAVLANIKLQQFAEDFSHRFDYAIEGTTRKNEKGEIVYIKIKGISALMPYEG